MPWKVTGQAPIGDRSVTCFPTEAVTTHQGTFTLMCRQVFGLADMDLSIRLLAPASQPQWASACESFRFRFTAAGQFRIHTGFPFKPDRRSRLDGHRQTQHIGCPGQGQPNKLWTSRGISRAARGAAGLRRTLKIVTAAAILPGCCGEPAIPWAIAGNTGVPGVMPWFKSSLVGTSRRRTECQGDFAGSGLRARRDPVRRCGYE